MCAVRFEPPPAHRFPAFLAFPERAPATIRRTLEALGVRLETARPRACCKHNEQDGFIDRGRPRSFVRVIVCERGGFPFSDPRSFGSEASTVVLRSRFGTQRSCPPSCQSLGQSGISSHFTCDVHAPLNQARAFACVTTETHPRSARAALLSAVCTLTGSHTVSAGCHILIHTPGAGRISRPGPRDARRGGSRPADLSRVPLVMPTDASMDHAPQLMGRWWPRAPAPCVATSAPCAIVTPHARPSRRRYVAVTPRMARARGSCCCSTPS